MSDHGRPEPLETGPSPDQTPRVDPSESAGAGVAGRAGGAAGRSPAEPSRLVRWATYLVLALCGVLFSGAVVSCQSRWLPWNDQPTGPDLGNREPEMRVRIRRNVDSTELSGAKTFAVRVATSLSTEELRGPLRAQGGLTGVRITDAKGKVHQYPAGAAVDVADASSRSFDTLTIGVDAQTYPGHVRLVPRTDDPTRLDVVNYVPMEKYLPGVIAKELVTTWPKPAFMAQAVCARSYALHERQRALAAGRTFDVEATDEDQVYGGLSRLPVAEQAVRETRGLVLTYRGRTLRAYYSSTCGGRPATCADIFPTGSGWEFNLAEPLQGGAREFACQSSPLFTWEVARNTQELSLRWREWGQKHGSRLATLGTIASVEPIKTSASGRPFRYAVKDTQGRTVEVNAEHLRQASNHAAAGTPEITKATRVNSGDFTVQVRATDVVIRGRGFGHGVGMCQYCSKGFSDRGMDWRAMLKLFYAGADIEKKY